MSEYAEFCRDMREHCRAEKAERLAKARKVLAGWFKELNEYHWRTTVGVWTLDYWPSTGKYRWIHPKFALKKAKYAEPELMLELLQKHATPKP